MTFINIKTRIAVGLGLTLKISCAQPNAKTEDGDQRMGFMTSLFTGVELHQNLNRLAAIFPSSTMKAG